MAGNDPQRQLLSLIRDFTSEKSHGERRVVTLKKKIEELRSKVELASNELEDAKRVKENTEQELKGYELQLSLNENSIQALETRISLIQEEINVVGSELDSLKNEEATTRDRFIRQMFDFNVKIRKFQETVAGEIKKGFCDGILSAGKDCKIISDKKHDDYTLRDMEENYSILIAQTMKAEEEYLTEQNIQKQLQQDLVDLEKRVNLLDVTVEKTRELQETTMQTSKLDEICNSLSMELQKRCICPKCNRDNVESLGGVLQVSEAA